MNDSKIARLRRGAAALRQQFAQQPGGVFSRVLGEQEIAAMVATHVKDYRERIYPPLDTLRLFVGQVLSSDSACQDVVGRRLSERTVQGKSASTLNTGSYCDARVRLPIGIPVALGNKIGERLESRVPARMALAGQNGEVVRWHDRGHARHAGQPTSISAKS